MDNTKDAAEVGEILLAMPEGTQMDLHIHRKADGWYVEIVANGQVAGCAKRATLPEALRASLEGPYTLGLLDTPIRLGPM